MGVLVWAAFGAGGAGAAVGGDFTLTDQHGAKFSLSQARGKVVLMFFGYTSCPDICPDTLSRVAAALGQVDAQSVQPVFVTLDPKRDSPARLREYVRFFDDRIVALTGSQSEIDAVARRFRVSFRQVGGELGYTLDHTANLYIIDGAGEVARIVPPGLPVTEIVRTIQDLLTDSMGH